MPEPKTLSRTRRKSLASARQRAYARKMDRRSRIRNLALSVVVVAAVAGGVAAWQVTGHGHSAGPTSPAAANQPSQPTPFVPHHVPEAAFTSQPPFTGPAVAKFGQPVLQKAYRAVVNFAFNAGWNTELMAKGKSTLTNADFDTTRSFLTPSCAKAFGSLVTKALGSDQAAQRELEGAVFFAIVGPGGVKPLDGPSAVTGRSFTRAKVGVDNTHGPDRLSFEFTVTAVVHLQDASGKQFTLPTERKVRYLLVANKAADATTRPFLIDAWTNKLSLGKLQAA